MSLNGVRAREALHRLYVLAEIHVAQAFIVPDFPVVWCELLCFVIDVVRRPMTSEQVERLANLL